MIRSPEKSGRSNSRARRIFDPELVERLRREVAEIAPGMVERGLFQKVPYDYGIRLMEEE
jgi:hypothetical protein